MILTMATDPEFREILQLSLTQITSMRDAMRQMRLIAISGVVKELLDSQIKDATAKMAEIERRIAEL